MCKDPPPISWRGVVYNPELTTSEGISPLVIRKCAAQINGVSRFSNGNLHSLEGYLHEYYSAESRTHIVPATFHFSFRRNITCNLQELKRKKKRELSGFSFSRLDTSIMCLFRPSLRKQCPNFVHIYYLKKRKKGGRRVSHFLMIQLFQISKISTVGRAVAWCTGDEKITGAVVQQAIYTGTVTGSTISTACRCDEAHTSITHLQGWYVKYCPRLVDSSLPRSSRYPRLGRECILS